MKYGSGMELQEIVASVRQGRGWNCWLDIY